MKITKEIKLKYFAMYYGKMVLKSTKYQNLTALTLFGYDIDGIEDHYYLSLRDVSQLTDEELIELAEFMGEDRGKLTKARILHIALEWQSEWKDGLIVEPDDHLKLTQWLCTKSVAVPYLGIPVEEWVAEGVVKMEGKG